MRRLLTNFGSAISHIEERPFLLLWTYLFLATPYVAFPGIQSGKTNATACIAAGILVVGIIWKLHPAPTSIFLPPRIRGGIAILGVAAFLPYAIFELGSMPWTLRPTTDTLTGFWKEPLAGPFRFIDTAVGYIPLLPSSALAAYLFASRPKSEQISRGLSRPCPRLLLGLVFAGLLKQPLNDAPVGQPLLKCLHFVLGACLALAIVAAVSRERDREIDCLLAYALGILLWNEASRVVGPPPLDPFVVGSLVALLSFGTTLLIIVVTLSRPKQPRGNERELPRKPSEYLCQLEGCANLSAAERGCLNLLVDGNASSEIAAQLGKSPSTVRVLLSRSYRKLGVSNAAELMASLEEKRLLAAGITADAGQAQSHEASRWGCFDGAFLLLAALPLWHYDLAWGIGRELYLPLGTGLFAAGIPQLLGTEPRQARLPRPIVHVLGGLCVALKVLQAVCEDSRGIDLALVASSFFFGVAFTLGSSDKDRPVQFRGIDFPPVLLALAIGVLIEELWRDHGYFSILAPLTPLAIALTANGAALLWRIDRKVAAPLLLGCAGLFSCLVLLGAASIFEAIALSCCAVSFCMAFMLARTTEVLATPLPHLAPSLGLGILAGDVLVGSFADRLVFNDTALRYFGGQSGLYAAGGASLGILSFAMALAVTAYSLRLSNDMDADALRGRLSPADRETRVLALFTAKGLTEQEAIVMSKIAEGLSGPEISETINYSRGAVNNLRLSGYSKLDIHSRKELISYISAGIGPVN